MAESDLSVAYFSRKRGLSASELKEVPDARKDHWLAVWGSLESKDSAAVRISEQQSIIDDLKGEDSAEE